MMSHPFTESLLRKWLGIILFIISWGVLYFLTILYSDIMYTTVLASSMIYLTTLSGAGYVYWFIAKYNLNFLVRVGITVIVQVVCLVLTLVGVLFIDIYDWSLFIKYIPLYFTVGTLFWIILLQWYNRLLPEKEIEENVAIEQIKVETEPKEIIDRISVKDGSKIHIIKVEDITHLQAYGDYVNIFTKDSRYVKENTMKFFESSLPDYFVRIHRSFIINTFFIARVELSGKDIYNIHLNTGVCIRASVSGYKILKQKLAL